MSMEQVPPPTFFSLYLSVTIPPFLYIHLSNYRRRHRFAAALTREHVFTYVGGNVWLAGWRLRTSYSEQVSAELWSTYFLLTYVKLKRKSNWHERSPRIFRRFILVCIFFIYTSCSPVGWVTDPDLQRFSSVISVAVALMGTSRICCSIWCWRRFEWWVWQDGHEEDPSSWASGKAEHRSQ
jgi:hypothetical protein